MFKKGKLAWEYVAVIILALAVLVVMLSFSQFIRDKALDLIQGFWQTLLGR